MSCRLPRSLQEALRRARRAASGAPCTRPLASSTSNLPRRASASYFLDEIRPRRVDRVLHEPDLDGALDRLTTRRDTELAVDGHRFGLRRVAGYEEPVRDLREGEMGREVGKQPQLRSRQAHGPGTGRRGARRDAVAQLPRLLDE